jgi:hypothetical protein
MTTGLVLLLAWCGDRNQQFDQQIQLARDDGYVA